MPCDRGVFFPCMQGHVYSLGCTLAAALDFVIEPELEPDLGLEVRRLLDQMQQKNPSDRPGVQVTVPCSPALKSSSQNSQALTA